jgi:hypothetical protein
VSLEIPLDAIALALHRSTRLRGVMRRLDAKDGPVGTDETRLLGLAADGLDQLGALLRLAAICRICSSGSTDRRAFQRKQRASPAPEALKVSPATDTASGLAARASFSSVLMCPPTNAPPAIRRRRTGESIVESSGASGIYR